VVVLYLNAALLACLLVAVLSRSGGSSVAMAAGPAAPQIAGGGSGLYIMPGQFASTIWGCYLLDADRQTLCVYEYIQGHKQLRLVAARDVSHDRQLQNFNTPNPTPDEVDRIVQLGKAGVRGRDQQQDLKAVPAVPGTQPAGQPGTESGRPPVGGIPPEGNFVPKPSDINNPPPPGNP
jgi:hypothetical protein